MWHNSVVRPPMSDVADEKLLNPSVPYNVKLHEWNVMNTQYRQIFHNLSLGSTGTLYCWKMQLCHFLKHLILTFLSTKCPLHVHGVQHMHVTFMEYNGFLLNKDNELTTGAQKCQCIAQCYAFSMKIICINFLSQCTSSILALVNAVTGCWKLGACAYCTLCDCLWVGK